LNTGGDRSPSLATSVMEAIRSRLVDVHTMLPGKIKTYYADKGTADIDLTIKQRRRSPDGSVTPAPFPTLFNVPIAFPRCAGGAITFPLAADDLVLVHFASRNLGDWVHSQAGDVLDPGDGPTHYLDGAIAYVGGYPVTGPLTPTPSTSNVVIRTENELHLGGQDPSEFVALATKVLNELDKIKTAFNGHKHTAGLLLTGASGGSPVTGSTGGPNKSYSSEAVAASKVKAV
jgi:hypothetical protein